MRSAVSETAAPYEHGCRQPCSEHTVCPGTATYVLPTAWGPANSGEVTYPNADTVTLSRADAELIERLAWTGYSTLREHTAPADVLDWQKVLVRLATALAS